MDSTEPDALQWKLRIATEYISSRPPNQTKVTYRVIIPSGCNGPSLWECSPVSKSTDPLYCALVQSFPLRAVRYCTLHHAAKRGRITDNCGSTWPGKSFRSQHHSRTSPRRSGNACSRAMKPCRVQTFFVFLFRWIKSKPHQVEIASLSFYK